MFLQLVLLFEITCILKNYKNVHLNKFDKFKLIFKQLIEIDNMNQVSIVAFRTYTFIMGCLLFFFYNMYTSSVQNINLTKEVQI